jgi:hypothetical protein
MRHRLALTRAGQTQAIEQQEIPMHGTNYWVIGGEFGSMNFHKLVHGTAQVQGPFSTRSDAEDAWRSVSEQNRHRAGVRFSIVEEPRRAAG